MTLQTIPSEVACENQQREPLLNFFNPEIALNLQANSSDIPRNASLSSSTSIPLINEIVAAIAQTEIETTIPTAISTEKVGKVI